jgi:hypothetical protein
LLIISMGSSLADVLLLRTGDQVLTLTHISLG